MKLKKFLPFLLGGVLTVAAVAPIVGVAVSCSSTPASDSFKANSGVVGDSGISTTGFKDVVSKLNLSNATTLSTLTDDSLNDSLKETDYKDLKLAIQDGSSEVTGTLKLKVTGTYNGKTYNDDITISNFVNFASPFTVSDVKINKNMWFTNGGPYSGGSQEVKFSKEVSIGRDDVSSSLIEDATFTFGGSSKLKWADVRKNFTFNSIEWTKSSDNKKIQNITFAIKNDKTKEYSNGQWTTKDGADQEQTGKLSSEITLPSFDDLLQNALDNITFKEDVVKGYYPSYFKGLFSYKKGQQSDQLNEAVKKIIDEGKVSFLKSYDEFKDSKLEFSTNEDDYKADDFNGTFSFKASLSANGVNKSKEFSSDKFKKIANNEFKDFKKEIEINNKQNSSEKKSNFFYKKFINEGGQYPAYAINEEITKAFEGKEINQSKLDEAVIKNVGDWWPKSNIYDKNSISEISSDKLNQVNENFVNFSLLNSGKIEFGKFGSNVKDGVKFDYDSALLNIGNNENSIIQVDFIRISAVNMKNAKLEKDGDDKVKLSFEVPITITLVNGKKITQTTTFKTTFVKPTVQQSN